MDQDEEEILKKMMALYSLLMFVVLLFFILISVTSCQYIPELAKAVDDIETDDAITIQIDRDAFKKDTDVFIDVKVINKDRTNASNQIQK